MATRPAGVDELVGAATAMRAAMIRVHCDEPCIDTCGTGGDGISTFNVSTTAAIIAASAGATVAKHGNRSTTRASGSTEALTHLGVDVEARREVVERSLAEVRIGYLNAQRLHPAMRFAAPVRRAIPVRTIFNLLGPLVNPAGARRQLLGVPDAALMDPMATALTRLGCDHVWIVHGADGLCDLSVTGSTAVIEVRDGSRRSFAVEPESVGLNRGSLDDLRVESPRDSANTIRGILRGDAGAPRDHALLNAGAALVVAGLASDLRRGVAMSADAIDDGRAMATLQAWRAVTGVEGVSDDTTGGKG
jgi:anthranilate phosphoribosyltransferase